MTAAAILTTMAAAAEGADGAHGAFYTDTSFWVGLSFLIFVGFIVWKGAHRAIGSALDARADKIKTQLDEARSLREEAQALLAKYQRQQRSAEDEANNIINQAEEDAKIMMKEAEARINDMIERRTELAEQKIAQMEAQAMADVKAATARIAIEAARQIIAKEMDGAKGDKAIDSSIKSLDKLVH